MSSQDIIQWDFDNCEAPLHMAALGAHVQVREKKRNYIYTQEKALCFFPYLTLCPTSLSTDAHDAARRRSRCQQVRALRVDKIRREKKFLPCASFPIFIDQKQQFLNLRTCLSSIKNYIVWWHFGQKNIKDVSLRNIISIFMLSPISATPLAWTVARGRPPSTAPSAGRSSRWWTCSTARTAGRSSRGRSASRGGTRHTSSGEGIVLIVFRLEKKRTCLPPNEFAQIAIKLGENNSLWRLDAKTSRVRVKRHKTIRAGYYSPDYFS